MEVKQIKDLMAAMGRTRVKKLVIKNSDGFELELERETDGDNNRLAEQMLELVEQNPMRGELESHRAQASLRRNSRSHFETSQDSSTGQTHRAEEEESGDFITSPMVGTFYSTPSPEDPAFVKVGDKVNPDSIVCIIEAMKVMNEVKAGISGTVSAILVDNGQPIEFGSQLFRVTPD